MGPLGSREKDRRERRKRREKREDREERGERERIKRGGGETERERRREKDVPAGTHYVISWSTTRFWQLPGTSRGPR